MRLSTGILIGGGAVGVVGFLLLQRKGAFLPCFNNPQTTAAEKTQCTADEKAARLAKSAEIASGILIAGGWVTRWLGS
jgi:hypothetical protein